MRARCVGDVGCDRCVIRPGTRNTARLPRICYGKPRLLQDPDCRRAGRTRVSPYEFFYNFLNRIIFPWLAEPNTLRKNVWRLLHRAEQVR
jgi:hypothetical protein